MTARSRLIFIVAAAAIAAFLIGWAFSSSGDASTSNQATSGITPTPTPSPSLSHAHATDLTGGEDLTPAVYSDEADAAALDVATRWIELQRDGSLERDEWLERLRPLVTDWYYDFYYRGGDPTSSIDGNHYDKIGQVTNIWIERGDAPDVSYAVIRTDAGEFRAQLIRRDGASPWRVASY